MKNKNISLFVIALLVLTTLACTFGAFMAGNTSLPDGLTEDYSPPPGTVLQNPFTYNADQLQVKQQYGDPDRFTILFSKNIRQETWSYDTNGYSVVFRNGVKVSEKFENVGYAGQIYATTYVPDQFYNGMGIDEIVLATGQNEFYLTSIDDAEQNNRLMHLEGLSIGLRNGQVVFVETYPAITDAALSQENPALATQPVQPTPTPTSVPGIVLTTEELSIRGTHKYKVVFFMDGDVINEAVITLEIIFSNEEVRIIENGESRDYYRTDTNKYVSNIDSSTELFIMEEGFTMMIPGETSTIEVLYSLLE